MKKLSWNNGQGPRNRQAIAVIVTADGGAYSFTGQTIPKVCFSQESAHEKRGKWSNTTYVVMVDDNTTLVSFREDWDMGKVWPQTSWNEAFEWLRKQAPLVDRTRFESFLREKYPKTATLFDEQKAAEEMFNTPSVPAVLAPSIPALAENNNPV